MAAKDINLGIFNINEFGGINPSNPIVMYVGEAYSAGKNIAIASGDQEQHKTTWLYALQGLFAQNFDIKEENFINRESGKIDLGYSFEFDGCEYRVIWTKSQFKLQQKVYNKLKDKEVWRDETGPVETIKKIIGYVGSSPMKLRTEDGAKQVTEVRKSLAVTAEVQEAEKALLKTLETATTARTEANREYTRLLNKLSAEPLYTEWEASEKKYAEEKTSETEKQKLETASKKKSDYELAEQRLKDRKSSKERLQKELQELKDKVKAKQKEVTENDEKITIAEDYLKLNKDAVTNYDIVFKSFQDVERYVTDRNKWLQIKTEKKEMDAFSDSVIKLDAQKLDLRAKILATSKQGMPNIEGLEVITSKDIDGRPVGVYLHGLNVAQLSESELWGLFLQIWHTQGVKYVFIENITSLGSRAVEILNGLAKANVKIFATKMARGRKFEITFTDQITDED